MILSPRADLLNGIPIAIGYRLRRHMEVHGVETAPFGRANMVKFVKPLSQVDQRVRVIEDGRHVTDSVGHAKESLQLIDSHVVVHLAAEGGLDLLPLEIELLSKLTLARGKLRVRAERHERGNGR